MKIPKPRPTDDDILAALCSLQANGLSTSAQGITNMLCALANYDVSVQNIRHRLKKLMSSGQIGRVIERGEDHVRRARYHLRENRV